MKRTIKGIRKEHIEVELDDQEVSDLVKKEVLALIGLYPDRHDEGHYVKDGKLIRWEEHYTSHSYTQRTTVRAATELDKAVFKVLDALEKAKK